MDSDFDIGAQEETGALLGAPTTQAWNEPVSPSAASIRVVPAWTHWCSRVLQSVFIALLMGLAVWVVWVRFPAVLSLDTGILAATLNGTYTGFYSPHHDQFLFLGMPYAQPPLGDLRLRPPRPLNQSWNGIRSAISYGPQCIGYQVRERGRTPR